MLMSSWLKAFRSAFTQTRTLKRRNSGHRRSISQRRRTQSAEHSQRVSEILEDRCLLTTVVWDGAPDGGGSSANADGSNDDNWAGDLAPTTNDDLVFPAGAAQSANIKDFVGESFGSILVGGDNHDLGGQPFVLNGCITIQGTDNAVGMDLQPGVSSGIADTGRGTFTVNGSIDLAGNDLSVSNSGGGGVEFNKTTSGVGGVPKSTCVTDDDAEIQDLCILADESTLVVALFRRHSAECLWCHHWPGAGRVISAMTFSLTT
jgi:hypothetical protein